MATRTAALARMESATRVTVSTVSRRPALPLTGDPPFGRGARDRLPGGLLRHVEFGEYPDQRRGPYRLAAREHVLAEHGEQQ